MRVPQSLDYALRAAVLLALQRADEYVAAGEVADRLGLPRRFVEQQVTALSRVGIVRCRRGATGGCSLARPAEEISVLEIVQAVQGDVLDVPRVTGSAVSDMWQDATDTLAAYLAEVTLADLAEQQRRIDNAESCMYWI